MIRSEPVAGGSRSAVNPMKGEFALLVGGELCRFDTRLATIASIEATCGDRPIVEILNAIIVGRRARDVIPLLAAALAAAEPPHPAPETLAERATVGEAEAFVLALVFALGFKVGSRDPEGARAGIGPFGRTEQWRRWREFALGGLRWSEAAFWDCSWRGLLDAWTGYRRFALGIDPDDEPMSRAEALALDRAVGEWQHTGRWRHASDG